MFDFEKANGVFPSSISLQKYNSSVWKFWSFHNMVSMSSGPEAFCLDILAKHVCSSSNMNWLVLIGRESETLWLKKVLLRSRASGFSFPRRLLKWLYQLCVLSVLEGPLIFDRGVHSAQHCSRVCCVDCEHRSKNPTKKLAQYGLILEFLISFVLKSKRNTLFLIDTKNVGAWCAEFCSYMKGGFDNNSYYKFLKAHRKIFF